MKPGIFPFLGLALALLGPLGCYASPPLANARVLALAPQSSALFQCGPTTLAAVFGFYGTVVPEKVISDAIYSPTARGALLTDLAWYAREKGFQTAVRTGTLEDLQRAVDSGNPPIVLLDLGLGGFRQPHFTAIVGWSDHAVRYQDRKPAGKVVSQQSFIRQWERAGRQYLLITPSP